MRRFHPSAPPVSRIRFPALGTRGAAKMRFSPLSPVFLVFLSGKIGSPFFSFSFQMSLRSLKEKFEGFYALFSFFPFFSGVPGLKSHLVGGGPFFRHFFFLRLHCESLVEL